MYSYHIRVLLLQRGRGGRCGPRRWRERPLAVVRQTATKYVGAVNERPAGYGCRLTGRAGGFGDEVCDGANLTFALGKNFDRRRRNLGLGLVEVVSLLWNSLMSRAAEKHEDSVALSLG